MSTGMRILYVLDRPELCGGVKVVFQHAELLRRAGHAVSVAGCGPRPGWSGWKGPYVNLERRPSRLQSQDLVVATFWTTVTQPMAFGVGPVAHFCQGYEGDSKHLERVWQPIEQMYSLELPTFVVSPHLGSLMEERFDRQWRLTPPVTDPRGRAAERGRAETGGERQGDPSVGSRGEPIAGPGSNRGGVGASVRPAQLQRRGAFVTPCPFQAETMVRRRNDADRPWW
jgi:hypothetical protein